MACSWLIKADNDEDDKTQNRGAKPNSQIKSESSKTWTNYKSTRNIHAWNVVLYEVTAKHNIITLKVREYETLITYHFNVQKSL